MNYTSPSKRVFTDETKAAIDASNTRRDTFVDEDLTTALKNIASRVRKSVMEGYNTNRSGGYSASTTPYSSPVKPSASKPSTPIFQSATDVLNSVYNSPRGTASPSPLKRGRSEAGLDYSRGHEEAVDSEEEEDDVTFILGPDANATFGNSSRKIKPLRKAFHDRTRSGLVDPFAYTAQTMVAEATSTSNQVVMMDVSGN
ncbi:hypothetical protein M422DRAFT_773744 [Sphaerobolus stellatus SS14]|nr:hypothetical protein M422DRAFT_773744 [Sphaerobolus stellatus SS14]